MATVAPPFCDSGASTVVCDASGNGTTLTWTVTIHQSGTSTTFTTATSGGQLELSCNAGEFFDISYSYVANGVTQNSDLSSLECNTGPWD